ncbi:MAG: GNAT family N-acetyltransferase [Pseudobdellovibrionaceae bacterium]
MSLEYLRAVDFAKAKSLMQVLYSPGNPGFNWPPEAFQNEWMSTQQRGVAGSSSELCSLLCFRMSQAAWEISIVATNPLFQKQGCAEFLLSSFLEEFRNAPEPFVKHDSEVWLEVHEQNIKAIRLYEKMGFSKVGRRPRYYTDGSAAILCTTR